MRVGILGGGQLGRMIALAGYPLGASSTVLEPAAGSSAAQVCAHVAGEFDDLRALYELAKASDVVTFEFENVPAETTDVAARYAPVRPGGNVLHVSQNRWREKSFLRDAGLPVTPFAPVNTLAERDGETQTGFSLALAREIDELDWEATAREAAHRAARLLGGTKPRSERMAAKVVSGVSP